MPEDLFKALCAQLKEKPKDDWKEGNRNNTLFKKVAMDMENNQGRNVPSIMDKAIKVGLSKSEVKKTAKSAAKTALQGNHGIDPGPELNGAGPPKEKATSGIEWVTAPKVQPTAKWLLPDFIPFGAYSVWAGPTGKGRTTTLLNILTLNARGSKRLPGTDQKGRQKTIPIPRARERIINHSKAGKRRGRGFKQTYKIFADDKRRGKTTRNDYQ